MGNYLINKWTNEDENFLKEKWGEISIKSIAKKLNRSYNSVRLKAQRLGLETASNSAEFIKVRYIAEALGKHKNTINDWIKSGKLKASSKRFTNTKIRVIKLPDFWKFAATYPQLINWVYFSPNSLGIEPKFIKDIRNKFKAHKGRVCTRWTKYEDEKLAFYYLTKGLSVKEISEILGRGYYATQARINIKGYNKRSYFKWTKIEENKLEELLKNGLSDIEIAKILYRTPLSIKYKRLNLVNIRKATTA